jgi:DNA-binding MarR family transcriptional regulator
MSSAAHRLGSELDRALEGAGFSGIRSAHAQVFMAVDGAGSRVTTLASRTHMTKQAMTEQVTRLTRAGYLEIVPDPTDGRAQLVRLTEQGWGVVRAASTAIDAFDAWLDSLIGKDQVRDMRSTLETILASSRSEWTNDASSTGG